MYHIPKHSSYPYSASQNVESLVSLTTRVVAQHMSEDLMQIRDLPEQLKSMLVTLLSRRNLLTPPVLRVLAHKNLRSISIQDKCLKDFHLRILQICENLVSLDTPSADFSSKGLVNLFVYLPHLQEINISSSKGVDNEVLKSMSYNCPRLRLVNIGKCSNFTDQGLAELAKNCHCLCVLDISYTKITDLGIAHLSKGCNQKLLKELHIDGCASLTSDCGQYLEMFSALSEISFYDCPQLLKSNWFQSFSTSHNNKVKNISFTI